MDIQNAVKVAEKLLDKDEVRFPLLTTKLSRDERLAIKVLIDK